MAPQKRPIDLEIASLRGGMNDTDPPAAIAEDQCVLAMNVEWFYSTLGERRLGCAPLNISGSGLDSETAVVFLAQRIIDGAINQPELWAIAATPGTSVTVARRPTVLTTWTPVTPSDAITNTAPDVYAITSQVLHDKLFFAYRSAQDRLHVWDGLSLRRAGLIQPGAGPSVVDEGSGSDYETVRYFRIRYVTRSGSTVLVRSEPSDSTAFTPSGTGAGAAITRPALIGEGETDWELEVSTDNSTFYKIATRALTSPLYNDETSDSLDYADLGELSEDVGDYLLLPSARYIAADGDRLLLGGHWTDPELQSRVMWTPVFNDPGSGNDERLPLSVDNFFDLDVSEGGPITGISQAANGTWYAFKTQAIYSLVRTGDATRAYDAVTITKARGAISGSIISGVDEYGRGCIYFLDPIHGPSRLGATGLETIRGLRQTWKRVNSSAADIIARGIYYPDKSQVHWWVAVDGGETPTLKLVLQVDQIVDSGASVSRGWSLADGRIAQAYSVAIFNEIEEMPDGSVVLSLRPFIGLTAPDCIQRCDTTDADAGVSYRARIKTRPYIMAGLLNKWGSMTAALLADANTGCHVLVKCIKDFGLDSTEKVVPLDPQASEDLVIKVLDSLVMSNAVSIQFEFSDPL